MPKVDKLCIACRNSFRSYDWRGYKYCSRNCYQKNAKLTKPSSVFKEGYKSWNTGLKGVYKGLESNLFKKGHMPWNYCKRMNHSGTFKKGHKPYLIGDNHWHWKGGITKANIKLRTCSNYKIWKDSVFSNYGYSCYGCGSYKNLHAHHLYSFKEYPEFRFETWNGQALCVECHVNLHSTLGWAGD